MLEGEIRLSDFFLLEGEKRIGKLDPFLLLEGELGWEHLPPESLFLLGKFAASQEADRQWTMGMAYKPVHKHCSAFQARAV